MCCSPVRIAPLPPRNSSSSSRHTDRVMGQSGMPGLPHPPGVNPKWGRERGGEGREEEARKAGRMGPDVLQAQDDPPHLDLFSSRCFCRVPNNPAEGPRQLGHPSGWAQPGASKPGCAQEEAAVAGPGPSSWWTAWRQFQIPKSSHRVSPQHLPTFFILTTMPRLILPQTLP